MESHVTTSRIGRHYESALRWIFLAAAVLFPLSNTISLLLPAVGLLSCAAPSFRLHAREVLRSKVAILTLLLMVVVLLQSFGVDISTHAILKSLQHYLIYIPIVFIGALFLEARHRRYASRALLCAASLVMLLQLLSMLLQYFSVRGFSWAQALSQNTLLHRLIVQDVLHHLQDRGPLLAIGFLLSVIFLFYKPSVSPRRFSWRYILYALWALLFVIAILSQGERVAYLCLLFALVYIGGWRLGWQGCVLAVFVFMVLLFAAVKWLPKSNYQAPIASRIEQLWQGPAHKDHSESTQMRIDGLHFAWKNIRYRPLWGFGVGAFHSENPRSDYIKVLHPGSVEPLYLHIILQLGLVGFLIYMMLLLSYWQALSKLTPPFNLCGRGVLWILCAGGLTFPIFLGTDGFSMLLIGIAPLLWSHINIKASPAADGNNTSFGAS